MDLKFRSDLLGKSVLFMGYSFRDINIRIIWFKLMQMMKDIPQADRPLSYIVRFEPNPCLDMLYESVGLRTIVLDPKAQADTESKKQSLFAEFLTDLGINVSPDAQIPGHARPLFVSASFLEMLTNRLDALVKARRELFGFPSREVHLVKHLGLRQINELLAPSVKDILLRLGRFRLISYVSTCAANYAKSFGAAPGVTLITAMSLTNNQGRSELFGIPKYPWAVAWNSQLSADDANAIIKVFKRETANHKDGPGPDNDLAWTTDPVARIANGEIASASNVAVVDAATKALAEASIIYPSIARYKPPKSAAPAVEDIIKEIQERTAQATDEPSTDFKDEDIPF